MNDDRDFSKKAKRIENIKKLFYILTFISLFSLLLIFLLDLKSPNPLFGILCFITILGVFISIALYFIAWIMDMHLAYERRNFPLLFFLLLIGISMIFIFTK